MDNDLTGDLAFTAEDIDQAIERCARLYNMLPPFVDERTKASLDPKRAFFFYGIAASLYEAEVDRKMRNDLDYKAGNVAASVEGKQIKHLDRRAKEYMQTFTEYAGAYKRSINYQSFSGRVG